MKEQEQELKGAKIRAPRNTTIVPYLKTKQTNK
jgi:hypothetical protein